MPGVAELEARLEELKAQRRRIPATRSSTVSTLGKHDTALSLKGHLTIMAGLCGKGEAVDPYSWSRLADERASEAEIHGCGRRLAASA
jgi:hypothetical protein